MKRLICLFILVCFLLTSSVAFAGLSVTLGWSPNSEPDLAGYNAYRSDTDGGPYTKIGSVPAGTEEFTDSTVEYDKNYYYVVTAFDNEVPVNESGYSNQVIFFMETPTAPSIPQGLNINVYVTIDK